MSIEVWRTRRPATNPLTHVLDRMFEQTFGPLVDGSAANRGSTDFQSLPVNVWETEDTYHVALTAPGLDEQTIEVTVQEDALAIEGTLAFQAPEDATAVWQEFNPGPATFRRSLRLGAPVDASRVEAVYRNGLLMLTLPKAAHSKPRQIHVTHGAAPQARKTLS
jgi:HSP20 family molecular chaperone IbpA